VCKVAVTVCWNKVSVCKNDSHVCKNGVTVRKPGVTVCRNGVTVCRNGVAVCKQEVTVCKVAVTACELEVTARKKCVTVCKKEVATRGQEVAVCKLVATAPPEHRTIPPEPRELDARCFMVCKIESATTLAGLAEPTRSRFQLKVERWRRRESGILCSQTKAVSLALRDSAGRVRVRGFICAAPTPALRRRGRSNGHFSPVVHQRHDSAGIMFSVVKIFPGGNGPACIWGP